MSAVSTAFLFFVTAAAEIFGCYSAYLWLRAGKSAWWIAPGCASLLLFAWLLTLHPTEGAGRIYAAYGGVYIVASLLWLWGVEDHAPDRWDMLGATICLIGAGIIIFAPRSL